MKSVSEATALVIDYGQFGVPMAQRLAREFKRVILFSDWEDGCATVNKAIVGYGFENVERVRDWWELRNDIDCFVFPDVGSYGLQLALQSMDFPVWGSRKASQLELNRKLFLQVLGEVGMTVPPHTVLQGVTELRHFLAGKEDYYVKVSYYRGLMETHHWRDYELDAVWLDTLSVKLGPARELIEFIAFPTIDTPIEAGGDTYNVHGEWPELMLHGTEAKDRAYLGAVAARDEMPEPLRDVMTAFAPVLKQHGYANQWSMEVRVKDDTAYFTDPTCRASAPGSASQWELWENFGDIVWHGANGELLQPKATAQFSAEVILDMKGSPYGWRSVELPESLQQWVKVGHSCEIDGKLCIPPRPQGLLDEPDQSVGWLVGTGKTPTEAIETVIKRCSELPEGLTGNALSLTDVLKEIKAEEANGMEFADKQLPSPSKLVEEVA